MDAKIHTHRGASDQSRLMDAMCINTIRTLSMDAVQAANSGHPGTPMALAPVAYSYGSDFCDSIPKIRSGLTAIDSCSLTAMLRCCFMPLLHLCGVKGVNPQYERSANCR